MSLTLLVLSRIRGRTWSFLKDIFIGTDYLEGDFGDALMIDVLMVRYDMLLITI